jgi:hypothetical protein
MYDTVQLREIFHLVFLRALVRTIPLSTFALKGGANLRFFFGSIRYSQDMDIDVSGVDVYALQEKTMKVLESSGLHDTLRTFGIEDFRLPDMARAKQTETVQRFKIGLLTSAGEDLATKVEYSRRGLGDGIRAESVLAEVMASYRLPPLIVPHYLAYWAALQKVNAISSRTIPQARDVFDLYLLSSRPEVINANISIGLPPSKVRRARETIYSISYQQYRDTVVNYLSAQDRAAYDSTETWDDIRLQVIEMLVNGGNNDR